jgi:Protein of unknown function (DUF2815)
MADPKNKVGDKKVITPQFRVSFPHMFQPQKPMQEGAEAKYSITMLFEKSADLKAMKKAADLAGVEKWGADKSKWPKNLKTPFKDGDEKEDLMGYEGTTYVTARSKQMPGLINAKKEEIIDENEFYAGCYARASLIAFAYETKVNRGISFALLNVQKLKDGERFGGRSTAQNDFDDVAEVETEESEQGYF